MKDFIFWAQNTEASFGSSSSAGRWKQKNCCVRVPEAKNEDTNSAFSKVFDHVGKKPRQESIRIGVKAKKISETGKHRPRKVRLSRSPNVTKILRIERNETYRNVYLSYDRPLTI